MQGKPGITPNPDLVPMVSGKTNAPIYDRRTTVISRKSGRITRSRKAWKTEISSSKQLFPGFHGEAFKTMPGVEIASAQFRKAGVNPYGDQEFEKIATLPPIRDN